MKQIILIFGWTLFTVISCNERQTETKKMAAETKDQINFESGYSEVNGLNMYYEIYSQGKPLALIHGGSSTIQSNWGKIIPLLAKN